MMKMPDYLCSAEQPTTPGTARENLSRRTIKATLSHTVTRVRVSGKESPDSSETGAARTGIGDITSFSCTVQLEIIGDMQANALPASPAPEARSGEAGGLLPGEADGRCDDNAGMATGGTERHAGEETIIGSGDRAHHLALKYTQVSVSLRPSRIVTPPLIAPGAPLSPSQRQRRCLQSGFCDPSSPLGCGGQFCDLLPDF
ncbi:hypothetical protein HBDW_24500 [Herbaspirillum sp. DW155]|uniref:hypothetical protein n=1 Tax=Herbaspirillum sp. DW155 TaxID=3095609 RepID=UPI00308CBD52|nr:hypothetical protein HBDW_24500 [Herbaspirillum sp. DW155]